MRPPCPPRRPASFLASALVLCVLGSGQAPPARLRSGASGAEVEALQRTLNARLDPSPDLTVDGDFGAGTRSALVRFQEARKLAATGELDPATAEALGPPPAQDPPVPPPSAINAEARPKKPADPLDGPPFTTAAAWAVIDGRTGELVGGHEASAHRDPASTTKMMTALIIVRLAATDPKALDEPITFSRKADETPGSTAGVREGEHVAARELLYGLLLPSGNDAAEAFAEHYGSRFPQAGDGAAQDQPPRARFIAEMNRLAGELGLHETRFANPHGLPAEGHRSSARDLARLARAALADPTFAAVVATPRRGATLVDGRGHARNVAWSNTNKLLDIEGYDGVKTGTTNAAGACLVASGRRGDGHLIVVVLGATAPDARYSDARNLFRWAWRRREH